MSEIKQKIEELRDKIWYHSRKYHLESNPEISDFEYDKLFEKLQDLEEKYPEQITEDSPTQRVAPIPLSEFTRQEHKVPMLSIENTYSTEELQEFDERVKRLLKKTEPIEYLVEPKIDGAAISIWYENGKLSQALTRGDGRWGELVTQNVRTIQSLPLKLLSDQAQISSLLEVRGEIYLSHKEFQRINEMRCASGEATFANPRNSAAGTLKLLDPSIVSERKLDFLAHSLGYAEGLSAQTQEEVLKTFSKYGIPVNPNGIKAPSIEVVIKTCQEWEEKRNSLPYDIDGMVVKVNRMDWQAQMGSTSRAPRWAVAYKFTQEEVMTRLREIHVQVGKGGTLTPVAILDPVHLAGTVVKRASLHNYDDIKRKGIYQGDWVTITKAGEIIPQVLRAHPEKRTGEEIAILEPTTCPACHSEVKKDDNGVYLRCTNQECAGGFKARLKFFASRQGMEIQGLGEKLIEQLVDTGLVTDFVDLYKLTFDDLENLERMGKKSAHNFIENIKQSKKKSADKVIFALGIRHVGRRAATIFAQNFSTMEDFCQASIDELEDIDEIGPVMALSVFDFFHSGPGMNIIEGLKEAGVEMEMLLPTTREEGSHFFSEKSVVLTGTLTHFTREELKEKLEALGTEVKSSISKNTDYLIAGEKAGSKLKKAQSLSITIIEEDELLQRLVTKEEKQD